MGFYVHSGTRELWLPSLTVGFLYLDQVQALERAFRVKSGVESSEADDIKIDAEVFGEFIKAVLRELQETNNGPLVGLSAGCIEVCLALNAKITGAWPTVPKGLEFLLAEAKNVMLPRANIGISLSLIDRTRRNWSIELPEKRPRSPGGDESEDN